MGADRKGPLAAFIVVAIIAAILLITSVRSQAATGWLGRALPSPPVVVDRIGGGLDQVVEQGAVIVHRTADLGSSLPPRDAGPSRTHAADSASPTSQPASQPAAPTRGHAVPTGHAHAPVHPVRQPATHQTTTSIRPGRHRGWSHADHAHARHDHARHVHGRHLGWSRHRH